MTYFSLSDSFAADKVIKAPKYAAPPADDRLYYASSFPLLGGGTRTDQVPESDGSDSLPASSHSRDYGHSLTIGHRRDTQSHEITGFVSPYLTPRASNSSSEYISRQTAVLVYGEQIIRIISRSYIQTLDLPVVVRIRAKC
jgi:hypothetical protein